MAIVCYVKTLLPVDLVLCKMYIKMQVCGQAMMILFHVFDVPYVKTQDDINWRVSF